MKKITFITFAVLLTMAFSAFASTAVPTPTEYLIMLNQASVRAADSTRAARLADTLSDHTTQLDLKATAAAVVILQATADECSTESNNAAASAAVAVAGIDRDTTLAIAAYASILDTATNVQTNLLKAQDTLNAIHTVAVRDSVLILANTTAIGLLPSTTVTTNIANQITKAQDTLNAIHTTAVRDSVLILANTTAIGLLPTTTHISNVAAQITAVDAIVDTSALRNWVVVTQGTATALPEGTTDTVCTVTGLVEIAYFGTEITTAQGTQTMKFAYWAGDLSISDSTADITGLQPGYIWYLTGTFANPPTAVTVATEAVEADPSPFRVRDCVIVIGQQLAVASDIRIKHTVCYRPLKQGSKIVMAD
jgi:hypothetical protein